MEEELIQPAEPLFWFCFSALGLCLAREGVWVAQIRAVVSPENILALCLSFSVGRACDNGETELCC